MLFCMNEASFSRSFSRPISRPVFAPLANSCLACVYTDCEGKGAQVCRPVARGVTGFAFAPTCTRCFGVTGGVSKAARYLDLRGVVAISNSAGDWFSSEII